MAITRATNIAGLGTFGQLLPVGSGTTTGTPDQPLQVFGGAYFSNPRVGIGTTFAASGAASVYLHGQGNNTVIRIQSGGSGNVSAELDLISNGIQNAFIDYGPNSLMFRRSDTNGSVDTSNILILDNTARIGINTGAATPAAGQYGALNVFAKGNTNEAGIMIDNNTTNNTASLYFRNHAGAGTSDIFNYGIVLTNGYGGPLFADDIQLQAFNGNTFPRSLTFYDVNGANARAFGLDSSLTQRIFKVGTANVEVPHFCVDMTTDTNIKVGVATTGYADARFAVGGDVKVTGITSTRKLSSEFPFVYKNLIVNGDFSIDQRLAGTLGTMATAGSYTGLDRWTVSHFGGDFTNANKMAVQQRVGSGITAVGISSTYMRISCNNTLTYSGGLGAWMSQAVEAYDLRSLQCGTDNAQPFWLSFWARTNVGTGFTMSCTLEKNQALETYSQRAYIPNDNTWRKYILRYEAPKPGISTTQWYEDSETNITGVQLIFGLTSNGSWLAGTPQEWNSSTRHIFVDDQTNLCTNTSNYIDLAGVQLEVGDSHTEFEHIPFEANLRRCQRAFETNAPYGVRLGFNNGGDHHDHNSKNLIEHSTTTRADANINFHVPFKVPKRKDPTMRGYIGVAGSSTTQWWVQQSSGYAQYRTFNADAVGKYGFNVRISGGDTWTASWAYGYWIANAE